MYVVMMARASSRASRASRASDLQKVGGALVGRIIAFLGFGDTRLKASKLCLLASTLL